MNHGQLDCCLLAGRYRLVEHEPPHALFPAVEKPGAAALRLPSPIDWLPASSRTALGERTQPDYGVVAGAHSGRSVARSEEREADCGGRPGAI